MKKSQNSTVATAVGDGAQTMLRSATRWRMTSATQCENGQKTIEIWIKWLKRLAFGVRCGWYAGDAATRRSSRRKTYDLLSERWKWDFSRAHRTRTSPFYRQFGLFLCHATGRLCAKRTNATFTKECLNAISFSIVWEIVRTCTLICCCWFCNFPFISSVFLDFCRRVVAAIVWQIVTNTLE